MRLYPADRVVDVGKRGGIAVGGMAEIDRHHRQPGAREALTIDLALIQIAIAPGPAMHLDNRGERPLALRLEQPSHELPVAVAEIFDVLRGVFVACHWTFSL